MVSETASTPSGGMILRSSAQTNSSLGHIVLRSSIKPNSPLGGRLLRSSTKTNIPPRLPVHEGSPVSVSKKSSKRKADKISDTIDMEGEEESEELPGTSLLKVRISLHYFVYVI